MNRTIHAEQLIEENGLDEIQARYLHAVENSAGPLTRDQRSALLLESTEMLGERPTQEWDDLVESLSPPESFAAAWIAEHPSTPTSWSERVKDPRNITLVLLVVAGVWAALWGYSYRTAELHISNNCSGAIGPAVEQLEASGETEFVMPFAVDARYGIVACVSAWENFDEENGRSDRADATIDRIYRADPISPAVQSVGWEIIDFDSTIGNAHQNQSISNLHEAGVVQVYIWFEGDRCNIAGSTGFGALDVDYTYRGQQRTGTVDLGASYTFSTEEGQCTEEVRAAEEELDRAWSSAVNGRLDDVEFINTQSVQLEQLGVSRDLCRYLRGIDLEVDGQSIVIEPLESRSVFQLEPATATALIDGAILGICPEFADQRGELIQLIGTD